MSLKHGRPFRWKSSLRLMAALTLSGASMQSFKTPTNGEWFTWSQGLDDTITAINAGAFDVSTLPEPVQITQRIVIPVKTENHRKCASYWSRATQTMLRTGYRTKVDTCGMDVEKTPERFVQLEAYFAAPHIHGEPAFGDKAAKARCRYHESAAA